MLIGTAKKMICPFIQGHGNCTPKNCMSWKWNTQTFTKKYDSSGKDAQKYQRDMEAKGWKIRGRSTWVQDAGSFKDGYCIQAKEKGL